VGGGVEAHLSQTAFIFNVTVVETRAEMWRKREEGFPRVPLLPIYPEIPAAADDAGTLPHPLPYPYHPTISLHTIAYSVGSFIPLLVEGRERSETQLGADLNRLWARSCLHSICDPSIR